MSEKWTEVITPHHKWYDLKVKELWRYRDLIGMFVKRDFVSIYKQTILGPLWHIIQPLLTTLTYYVIFGRVANISTDGIPQFLFYLSGTTVWSYFSVCLTKTSDTFIENADLFGKVYFPRLAVPISNVISALFSFTINFLVFLCFFAYYAIQGTIQPNIWILALPLFLIIMALFGLSLGIIISSLTTKYRDLRHLVSFGVQLFMFATPVIYPMSILSPERQTLLSLNPVSAVVEGFRYGFLGSGVFNLNMLMYSIGITILLFVIGLIMFNRVQKTFMDTV